jgi:hypothetical protein
LIINELPSFALFSAYSHRSLPYVEFSMLIMTIFSFLAIAITAQFFVFSRPISSFSIPIDTL